MLITVDGLRFDLAPWRARRVLARAREIAKRRRVGQPGAPTALVRDLARMIRLARPVGNLVHRSTGQRLRVFEARQPDGVFRLMTRSTPGVESVVDVTFRSLSGELELEGEYSGSFSVDWKERGPDGRYRNPSAPAEHPVPIPLVAAAAAPALPGVYILFRRGAGGWLPKYVGKAENLQQRLGKRITYASQHGDLGNLRVLYGVVLGPGGGPLRAGMAEGIAAAEHALIRTLQEDSSAGKLTNQQSINPLSAGNRKLEITSILPRYVRQLKTWGFHSSYASNAISVPAGQRYELV